MKPVRTLVLIANEREARILENAGVGKGLAELSSLDASAINSEAIEYADTPGRSRAAPGTARHGFEPPTSERRQARDAFAAHVLDALHAQAAKGGHERLILAAPPKMLGELRGGLGQLADKVTGSLDKDIVKVPARDLPRHFEAIAAF
ncbi:hypothetical protein DDZ14_05665 [Maritimibacter sp. 55A14]|uniref:host attachment protein n=1 Tax=Maritimibacter sp. 55A14 TaxID=2174844 RepID=UPI000D607702|nr:host attachment protein [Maritimibacter sp. 55A14]PWE33274.1 hypothetical protein DDZ14_05665 [Maritimibacter sp. 55A14]